MKVLSLFISIFMSLNCFCFYARMSEDPEKFCKEDQSELEVFCELKAIQLPKIDTQLLTNLDKVSKEFNIGKLNDLKAAYSISEKIVKQIKNKEQVFKDLGLGKKPELEKSLKNNLDVITSLKYDLNVLKKSKKCSVVTYDFKQAKKNKECAKKEQKQVEDLVVKIAILVSQNPILGLSEFEKLSQNQIKKRNQLYKKKVDAAKNCKSTSSRIPKRHKDKLKCQNLESLNSKQIQDNYFNIPTEGFNRVLKDKIPEMLESFNTVKKRHSQVMDKISNVKFKESGELRDEIFLNREISRDYYLTAEVENPESEYSNLGAVSCRILKEYKANEKNAVVNSMALDLGLMVIPIFGPARFAKTIGKMKNIKTLPNIMKRLTHYSQANKVATLATELGVMGIDTTLIKDEIDHCEQTLAVTIGVGNIKNSSEKVQECNELLNQMTLSYVSGVLVGGIATKNLLKTKYQKTNKVISPEESLYTSKLDEIYDPDGMNCHDNIHRLAKEFKNSGVDLSNAKVIYILPDGISEKQKLPYNFISGDKSSAGANWNHHVIMVKDGKVYDPDFPRDRVPTVKEYMNEMFPEVMSDGSESLVNIRMREFDASEYINDFAGGSSAAGLRSDTDIRTVESTTTSIGEYYNRYSSDKLSVPKARIPRGYDQYNNPIFLSDSGVDLVDESGDAIELSGRITTLDGSVKWLDDDDIIEQLKKD